MTRFANKTAVITGGGHGIGRATAVRLALEGARVAVLDLDGEAAVGTAEECQANGGDAYGARVDVSRPDRVQAAVQEVLDRYGQIDVLHSNAGRLTAGTVLEVEPEEWDLTFAVNVRSMFLMVRAVIPSMLATGRGAIVSTGSTSGLFGDPGLAAYDASKGAVVNFTRQLATEYAALGIRVNCVCPGWVDTGFNDPAFAHDNLDEAAVEQVMYDSIPMKRQGTPEEIAAAVCFLASDDASFISGHALVVDGGQSARF